MPALVDIAGESFGRLTVLHRVGVRDGKALWKCQCSCGAVIETTGGNLRGGITKSCGCFQKDTARSYGKKNKKHGMRKTKEYAAWRSMIARCNNIANPSYGDYGGRGITVCDEWAKSFEAFFKHVGPATSSGHSLDRVDSTRGYEPGNVRWATTTEQNRNRPRSNVVIEHDGLRLCVAEWAVRLGISKHTIHARLKAGWSTDKVLSKEKFSRWK
jgi:hypothetical protein